MPPPPPTGQSRTTAPLGDCGAIEQVRSHTLPDPRTIGHALNQLPDCPCPDPGRRRHLPRLSCRRCRFHATSGSPMLCKDHVSVEVRIWKRAVSRRLSALELGRGRGPPGFNCCTSVTHSVMNDRIIPRHGSFFIPDGDSEITPIVGVSAPYFSSGHLLPLA